MLVSYIKNIFEYIKVYFYKGDKRTISTKKNIFQTFLIRFVSVPISFLIVPLTLNYVNSDSYGIWITLSSIVAWMSFFDIGINNGLRNKLTESLAQGDLALSKKYVSTVYLILVIISAIILGLFILANFFLNWSTILNTSSDLSDELSQVALIVFGYFCLKFVLSTINTILMAHQLPAQAAFRGLIEQVSSLLVIFLLTRLTSGSLLNLSLGLCIAPLLILLYFNISLFFGKFKNIRPSFNSVDFSVTKNLMGVSIKFFVIQIAGIVQFQTANFIIIQSFGPEEVTIYNIVFKYFSVLSMLMGIFLTPIWSAVTEAYAKKEFDWIKNIEKKFRHIGYGLIGFGFIMLILSSYFYDIWLGDKILKISFSTSFFMLLFISLSIFGSIYGAILNGISALNVQFISSIFSPFVFIIFAYIFINYFRFGINSLIISSILANFNGYILAPLQYRKIFYGSRYI